MSAHRLIGYHFGGTSTVAFDAYGRSLLRHRGNLLIRRMPSQRNDARVAKNETLVRRGNKWFRYDAPDNWLFRVAKDTDGVGRLECIAQAARPGITFQALAPRHRTCFRPSVRRL